MTPIETSAVDMLETLKKIQVIAYSQVDGNKSDMRFALIECIRIARISAAGAKMVMGE